jgi:hypothetical protein
MGGTYIMAKEDYGQLAKEVVAAVGKKILLVYQIV